MTPYTPSQLREAADRLMSCTGFSCYESNCTEPLCLMLRAGADALRVLAGMRAWLIAQPKDYSYALAELDRLTAAAME